jgi:hypothetical protein
MGERIDPAIGCGGEQCDDSEKTEKAWHIPVGPAAAVGGISPTLANMMAVQALDEVATPWSIFCAITVRQDGDDRRA